MRSNIHTSRLRQTVEINMTPLMDLTFTLLIVFIITVPVINYTTDVNLPELKTEVKNNEKQPDALFLELDDKGVCASSGSACTSGSLDPSHVLLAIGRPHEVAHGSLRLSLSEENTMEEVEYTINAVKEVVSYLRGISPVWRDLMSGKRQFIIK